MNKGAKFTEEHKHKLRLAKLGTKQSEQHKKAIGLSNLGKKRSIEFKEQAAKNKTGKGNPMWKGGTSHYRSVHSVIAKRYGKASFCENKEYRLFPFFCEESSIVFDWAKRTHSEYTTDRNDYYQLCRKCHKRYDKKI